MQHDWYEVTESIYAFKSLSQVCVNILLPDIYLIQNQSAVLPLCIPPWLQEMKVEAVERRNGQQNSWCCCK